MPEARRRDGTLKALLGRPRDGGFEYTLEDGGGLCRCWRTGSREEVQTYLYAVRLAHKARRAAAVSRFILYL